MKKHLIAAAVAGAVSMPVVAQNVTVFGIIDVGYASHERKNQAGTLVDKVSGVNPGNHAGSRLGFRGEEDLGGGLKASFHLEMGIAPNKADGFNSRASGLYPGGERGTYNSAGAGAGGYTNANNRQSWIQLAGGFGSVRAGYLYSTSYNMVSLSGLAASEMPGHRQNATNLATRTEAIQYTSPKIGDITVAVQLGQGDATSKNESTNAGVATFRDNRSLNSINVLYAAGPLYVGVDVAQNEAQATANAVKIKTDATHLGISYDLGVAKVAYVYGDQGRKASAAATKQDITTNALTVFVPVGAAVPFLQYGTTETKVTGAKTSDITGFVVGARYNLSKRTLGYVMHGSNKDDLVTTTTAHKETRTVIGLAHSF